MPVVLGTAAFVVPSIGGGAQAAPADDPRTGISCEIPENWSSCVQVRTELDRAPVVGGTARLTIEVSAAADVTGARLRADLPAALDWQREPAGWRVTEVGPQLPEDGAGVHRATRTVDVKAGKTLTYTATVRGVDAAATSLRASVAGGDANPLDDDSHMSLLTVGKTTGTARLGLDTTAAARKLAPLPAGLKLQPSDAKAAFQPVTTEGLPKPHSDDPKTSDSSTFAARAMSCVTGAIGYQDQAGTGRVSPNIQVQAWDEDPANSDDLLDVALTDAQGRYRMCFDNDDVHNGQDVYVKVLTENPLSRVASEFFGRTTYEFQSAQRDDIADGRTVDFGRLAPGNQLLHRTLHAFDMANDAQEWTPGECWDERDTGDCRRMEIVYPDTDSNDNSRYTEGDNTVRLEEAAPDDRSDTVHEYGHAVMDDVYDDNMPEHPNCSPHAMGTKSSAGCAWTEGFANFYPMAIYNDDFYRGWRVENTSGYDPSDETEGRVTGSLWDLKDPAGEQYWDNWTENPQNAIWDTFLDRRSANFKEFWEHRRAEGHDVGSGPAGALYQNGIDYGFRFQLADGAARLAPTPDPQHNYRFDTTYRFWSVVAIRPPAGNDYDLRLYDDHDQQQFLAGSLATGDTVDFVAVDSSVRDPGDYYPVVRPVGSATGDYRIELSDGGKLLTGSATQAMNGADDIVSVWDTCPATGTDVKITVTPSAADQDAEVFVMDSDPSNAVLGRVSALAEATGNGPGQPEELTFKATGGCHGIVLVNKAGSGTYTLTES
ncbi:hypothetical protein G5C51_23980 [Streptomyces sp. A7024]|uniref:Uncharacterized protein n=1 Tax=Streptomyces coryli TaxID=1128680 RepID=A0A6G4U4D8_9ACTN|nr:hypothetical protein [Streptomyces coryli]NGN66953.1 hypothetical protein [Streptomyces coryli]